MIDADERARITTRLREQLNYYRARAHEYDEWWLRKGRYDRGAVLNGQWFADASVVISALKAFAPAGRILELACGSGIWTEKLLSFAAHLTAVDGSREMLDVNAARLRSPLVRYVEGDLFEWKPGEQFDVVFFGFWLSHVPPERFDEFWKLVRSCLAPGGRVFFVDSRREPTSTAVNHRLPEPDAIVGRRKLNDGREFHVYKIFYEPEGLTNRLRRLGWQFEIRQTDHYFLYGSGEPNELRT
jgi:demethylmenaquinone methyltransferase/2-methoxy-6-polyprenyl-1,4-benzoquinol methylase